VLPGPIRTNEGVRLAGGRCAGGRLDIEAVNSAAYVEDELPAVNAAGAVTASAFANNGGIGIRPGNLGWRSVDPTFKREGLAGAREVNSAKGTDVSVGRAETYL